MEKKQVRTLIRNLKQQMTQEQIEDASMRLQEKLLANDHWFSAQTVYLYISINQEVRTSGLIRAALESGKQVAVPLVVGDDLVFKYITSPDDLRPGYWNVPEPDGNCTTAEDKKALVIMPGLAFDRNGYRLGYGKGFYDRFLASEPDHYTIALCYDFQMIETVPHDEYDRTVNEIISVEI